MKSAEQIISTIIAAVDNAINLEDYSFNFFSFLEKEKTTKKLIASFMKSSIAIAIKDQSRELDLYINDNQYVKTYDWIGKERALKTKNYLDLLIQDAETYGKSRERTTKRTANK